MERKSGDIYVEDVYELAAQIGDEFQKLIDSLGSDSIKFLMPKVIRVLEHLEMLAILKEDFDSKLDSLKQNIIELEHHKREKALNQNKYELEMESIEENWRKENLQLTQFVSQLRHQNLKLSNTLIDNEKSLSQSLTDLQKRGQMEIDSEIISLKESIRRSENKIESITKEMDSKDQEIEKLSSQLEEVMQQNRDLRRRVKQSKHLWSESVADHKIKDTIISDHISGVICDKTDGQKMFSLSEIQSILKERNYLKSRLNDLEDEFTRYKSSANSSMESKNDWTDETTDEPNCDDLPVQGPINREPDDKLFPQKHQNKILRFFPSLSWPRIKRP